MEYKYYKITAKAEINKRSR